MNDKIIEKFLASNSIKYVKNASLKLYTWIHRGGVTMFWVQPEKIEELISVVSFLYENQIKFDVVGATSNIYFLNTYNPLVVISTLKINRINISDDYIESEYGVLSSKLSFECVTKGFEGFEGLVSLPGTIGGAVCNNSSCYNSSVEDMIEHVDVLTTHGLVKLDKQDLKFKRRSSVIKSKEISGVILKVYFRKQISMFPENLIKKSESYRISRNTYQQSPSQNLGSVYSNIELKNSIQIIIWKLFKRFIRILNIKKVSQQMWNKNFFFLIHGKFKLNSYVSDYSLNCFLWKD